MEISRFLFFLGFAPFFRDDEKDENQRQIEKAETKQIPRRFGVTAPIKYPRVSDEEGVEDESGTGKDPTGDLQKRRRHANQL